MCTICPHGEPVETTAWFNHVWWLRQMQQGGYPFEKNDLTIEEWQAIAEIKAAMEMPPETDTGGKHS